MFLTQQVMGTSGLLASVNHKHILHPTHLCFRLRINSQELMCIPSKPGCNSNHLEFLYAPQLSSSTEQHSLWKVKEDSVFQMFTFIRSRLLTFPTCLYIIVMRPYYRSVPSYSIYRISQKSVCKMPTFSCRWSMMSVIIESMPYWFWIRSRICQRSSSGYCNVSNIQNKENGPLYNEMCFPSYPGVSYSSQDSTHNKTAEQKTPHHYTLKKIRLCYTCKILFWLVHFRVAIKRSQQSEQAWFPW